MLSFLKLGRLRFENTSDNDSNGSWYPADLIPFCVQVQTTAIYDIISIWDLFLLVPNLLFVIYLLVKWYRVKEKMKSIKFPILSVFYNLILLVALLMIIRCIVTIFIKPVTEIGEIVNKCVWLVVRFGQLATELSVVFFGLFFGRLESNKSIIKIMSLTIPISLIYIVLQASLEFLFPDKNFIVQDGTNHYYDLYGHGGMIFWFVSSSVFAFIYTTIFILPYTRIKQKFPLPTKKSFYAYCLILAVLCVIQSIGSALIYANIGDNAMCMLDATTYIYFTIYGPLVYIVFLRKFFHKETEIPSAYFKEDEVGTYGSINNSTGGASDVNRSYSQAKNIIHSPTSNQHSSQYQASINTIMSDTREDDDERYFEQSDDDDTKVIFVGSAR